jgi:hypothetical protein
MVDQLRSSSPGHSFSAAKGNYSEGDNEQRTTLGSALDDQSDPEDASQHDKRLFHLSDSQVSFPYSQWQGGVQIDQTEDTPTESESEDETLPKPTSSVVPKFRKLTDISQAMFSQDILSPTLFPSTTATIEKPTGLPSESDDEEDDGDDSDSDSDAQGKSHIPKSRRAGANLQSKKAGGLLCFA